MTPITANLEVAIRLPGNPEVYRGVVLEVNTNWMWTPDGLKLKTKPGDGVPQAFAVMYQNEDSECVPDVIRTFDIIGTWQMWIKTQSHECPAYYRE
jgi:hypothetical protein